MLFARIEKDGDIAYLPLYHEFKNHSYGAYPNSQKRWGHIRTWGTTAQGVYRAGDKIQYKIYVRNQDTHTFSAAPSKTYTLKIIDPMGKVAARVNDIELSEFGAIDGEFRLLESATVGWYRFELQADFAKEHRWTPMSVLVSDFTPAPFRIASEIEGKLFAPEQNVTVQTSAKLHAGGPYTDAVARVTARLVTRGFSSNNPEAKGFSFTTNTRATHSQTIHNIQEKLNNQGEHETSFKVSNSQAIDYGRLIVESAVRDDRGKYIAAQSSATFFGTDRFVGLRMDAWTINQGKEATVQAIVVDEKGVPQDGTKIDIQLERKVVKASRVKGAGNAYLTKYIKEWIKESECELTSTNKAVTCSITPNGIGNYRITATINDTSGRAQTNRWWTWSVGNGQVLWETSSEYKLDIIPQQSEYKIGDIARFLVKNPYPGANALVSIERYGILKSWTTTLNNSTEIIEVPVEKDFLPGVYFSVVVMSPRVDKPLGTGNIDLGKPTYRVGYVKMPVRDPYKEINITVFPKQEEYKPQDEITVDLQVKTKQGEVPDTELAVAVLDEAVFDLITGGKNYFDPYKGFYSLRSLDVRNYNLLKQLVGQRKFEKKGANPGGGGGKELEMRNIFKFVSYWNPSIKPDASGKATISFKAPDNLTGWRVLALAVTKSDRMGLGQGTFKVNKPTEIRQALPNQVIEGDEFTARFTIMNRTSKKRTLNVTLQASGPVTSTEPITTKITAAPFKRAVVRIPVKTKNYGEVTLSVKARDDIDTDALKTKVRVNKRSSLEVAANYGTTTDKRVSEQIAFPHNIREDVGRVSVVTSPSVIAGLEGAFKYLLDYPYHCWEQKITKAVAATQYLALKQYLPKSIAWKNANSLIKKTLKLSSMYQAPNGGMTFYKARNEYVSPYLSAYTAIAFNWITHAGFTIPKEVEDKLHDYLLTFLRKGVQPDFYSESMASTVRAVALSALATNNKVNQEDIQRYAPHRPQMSLFGRAHFLQAALEVGGLEKLAKDTMNNILSSANESGGKFVFSEALEFNSSRILESPLRTNCAILSSVLYYQDKLKPETFLKDVPFKIVRYVSQSRKREHWENTQENIFCLNALVDYSKAYEAVKPNFRFSIFLDTEKLGSASFSDFRNEPLELDRKIKENDSARTATLLVDKQGNGRIYYTTRLFYSPKKLKQESINSGIEIAREYSVERKGKWILLKDPTKIQQGELVRVDLFLSLPAARNFVVINDPVPGGLEPVNTQLATASSVDAAKGAFRFAKTSFWYQQNDWISYGWSRWSFYHQELRHDSVRFYSEYLPPGNYHLSYVAQAIAPGEFAILPSHTEQMYDPDVFGKSMPGNLFVQESE